MLLVNFLVGLPVGPEEGRVLVLLYVLGALLLGFLLAGALDWMMVRPIQTLARQVRAAAESGWSEPLALPREGDELGDLGQALEELRASTVTQREELEQRLATIGELAAGVAHEVNNPNGVVLSRVSYLLRVADDEGLDPDVIDDLQTIEHQAQRVSKVASALLDFVRPGPTGRQPVELAEVVELTVALLRPSAREAAVDLVLESGPEPRPQGRRDRLEQVAFNLVKNAIECGGTAVTVRMRPDGFEVGDDGPGIDAARLPRVFEPFYTTKADQGGTGLGLAVSYGIVKDHGGDLQVQSSASGTTFTVRFPRGA
jgi:two-component system, NtrC family, sensor kinase